MIQRHASKYINDVLDWQQEPPVESGTCANLIAVSGLRYLKKAGVEVIQV